MIYIKNNIKKRKKPSIIKWLIYAAVLLAALFIFIPRYLIHKACNIIEEEIPDSTATVNNPPSKKMMTAYNYLQVAKFFPLGEKEGIKDQKFIMDYYFPLFKTDYNKLKFACVDNAISKLKENDTIPADSINIIALKSAWRNYPDSTALEEFREKWDSYHKKFAKSIPEYPRFIDAKHL